MNDRGPPLSAPALAERQQPFLDFLRASAALLVLLSHTRNWFFLNIDSVDHPGIVLKLFWFLTVLGNESVVVFFVLSGFLVGGSIRRSMQAGSFSWGDYLIARFARIYVVYLPALFLTAVVFWLGPHLLQDPGGDWRRPIFSDVQWTFGGTRAALCHVAGMQGYACGAWKQNPPLWSLGYEWALYLFAPMLLILVFGPRTWGARVVGMIIVVAAAGVLADEPGKAVFWCAIWFLGVAAHEVLKTNKVPLLAGLTGCMLAILGMALARMHQDHALQAQGLVAFGIALAISCRPVVQIQWAPHFFKWSASFSYSLYATHVPVVYLMVMVLQALGAPASKGRPYDPMAYFGFAVTVAVALLVGYVFSIVTERQTSRLRQLLAAGSRRAHEVAPSSASATSAWPARASAALSPTNERPALDSPRP